MKHPHDIAYGTLCDGVQVRKTATGGWAWRHVGEGDGKWSATYPTRQKAVEEAKKYWDEYAQV